ncbi:MAG: M28 family peptidase [Chloroflexi bacterium]|nr:M28 family peptidase [Chloroflexota bacterium]
MIKTCQNYLSTLCEEIPERPVGSEGNRQATRFFQEVVEAFGWDVESTPFQAMDWQEEGGALTIEQTGFQVFPSPYSLGCKLEAELVAAPTLNELEELHCQGKLLLLYGDLAKEQLMPKKFVFYNPEEHQQIIATLERKEPAAILTATGRNASLAGGIYPFPLIEDGDFQIPSVYLTEDEGQKILPSVGKSARLISKTRRKPSPGVNLIARKGSDTSRRIAISAHIDAKVNTPGAIDNATGVIVLLLAESLQTYRGDPVIELLPFNGEDYYAAPGQLLFRLQNQDHFEDFLININLDGAGYFEGPSAFSPFNLPDQVRGSLDEILDSSENLQLGQPWYQGDHSIFLQQGVPAVAVSSKWFIDHVDTQEITHTPKDHPGIVDCQKLIDINDALVKFLQEALIPE